VAAEEYDELSKLCDRLLGQQEQLQEEVRKQAEMLKVIGMNILVLFSLRCAAVYSSRFGFE
jgi:hypothetical protein